MTQLDTTAIDQARADAFAGKMISIMNSGALSLMISIGHRTGLFDAMATMPASTSVAIAEKTGLNERYVREWLGAMATGRIVVYDPAEQTYMLPAEHAGFLTRSAGSNNIAGGMQFIAVLASVEGHVVDSFRNGGGVDYCRYHRFHEVMAEESALTVVGALHEHILPLVPGLTERLEAGIDVADIGCGSGRAICALAEAFPASRFVGYDLCKDAVAAARAEAQSRGLKNAAFEVRDLTRFDEVDQYDLITAFDAIHDQKDPAAVLRGVHRSLRAGGTFLMQDIRASSHVERNLDNPLAPYLYTISTMHCMTVSLAQDGAGLGTCWGEELAVRMLKQAGFTGVTVQTLPHDMLNNYYVMGK